MEQWSMASISQQISTPLTSALPGTRTSSPLRPDSFSKMLELTYNMALAWPVTAGYLEVWAKCFDEGNLASSDFSALCRDHWTNDLGLGSTYPLCEPARPPSEP